MRHWVVGYARALAWTLRHGLPKRHGFNPWRLVRSEWNARHGRGKPWRDVLAEFRRSLPEE